MTGYFSALLDALRLAEREIFIADWWLTPYLYLRRQQPLQAEDRLDQVLVTRAMAGVHIYVAMYKELKSAVGTDSQHAESILKNLAASVSPDKQVFFFFFLILLFVYITHTLSISS